MDSPTFSLRPFYGFSQYDATHIHHILRHITYTCLFGPDLMAGGKMEPTVEASNRPQIPCSPRGKWRSMGEKMISCFQLAADRRAARGANETSTKNFRRIQGAYGAEVCFGESLKRCFHSFVNLSSRHSYHLHPQEKATRFD